MNDIPSAVTTLEREKLRYLARGKRVLVVGALLGHSTVALAKLVEPDDPNFLEIRWDWPPPPGEEDLDD